MADDIVTRLREHWEDEKMLGNDLLCEVLRDASDEIERLWERLLMWRETADALHYDYCCADGQAVLGGEEKYRNSRNEWDQWEKAVRGNA